MYSHDTTAGETAGRKCGKRYHCSGCDKLLWRGTDAGGHFSKCFDCREADAEHKRKGKRRCVECDRSAWGRRHRCRSCHREHVREANRRGNLRAVLRSPEKVRDAKRQYRNSAKGRDKQRIYMAKYRARHAEKIAAQKAAYALANRQKINAAHRKIYWSDPEAARKRNSLNQIKYRDKYKEKRRSAARKHYAANRDELRAQMRERYRKRELTGLNSP